MDYMTLKAENRTLNRAEILTGATHIRSRPLFFWFDLNGSCNLKCRHCGFHIYGRTSDREVSEEIYCVVLSELMRTAYVCNLGGTNWGECTISKVFPRFLQDCKDYQVRVNLTTNGTRMSDEWFDNLLDTASVVGFSMEGMEDELEKIRGFKWRSFLKNVEKTIQGRADRNKDFRVEWRFCAHAENIHQLPDMIRLAKRIGLDRIQVMTLIPFVRSQKFKNLYYHRSVANQFLAEARRMAENLGFRIDLPPDFDTGTWEHRAVETGVRRRRSWIRTTKTEMANCYHPWQTCSINELGNVKPCCTYWRSMGSLAKSSFDAIWNGRKYRRLRASVNRKPDKLCHACRLPQFDSDKNRAASQLVPGIREVLRDAIQIRREKITFSGVMNKEFDPQATANEAPSETGSLISSGHADQESS